MTNWAIPERKARLIAGRQNLTVDGQRLFRQGRTDANKAVGVNMHPQGGIERKANAQVAVG